MGVTVIEQPETLCKQSLKELVQGERRSRRKNSSSYLSASIVSADSTPTKTSTSSLTRQLRLLRRRYHNKSNDQSDLGKCERKETKPQGENVGKKNSVKRKAKISRKYKKTDFKEVDEEESHRKHSRSIQLGGIKHSERTDNKKDLKQNKSSRSNNTPSDNSALCSIKPRPPVKLTVKFNKFQGHSKKLCQLNVVNSSPSVLSTNASSIANLSEIDGEPSPTMSPASEINDIAAGTSTVKSIKGR